MSRHKTWVAGSDPWQGRCVCEARGQVVEHRWEAEDWNRTHMEQVERARAHLYASPSLSRTRDHFREMEATCTDLVQKGQWKMLADEIDHRLGNFPHDNDAPLW
jgi:hypothetical protein